MRVRTYRAPGLRLRLHLMVRIMERHIMERHITERRIINPLDERLFVNQ
ncbi:hypothetical protein KDI_12330 [Dictyobacter arantiisoli]|uniref:Uncharacterized protein n=1 Tax=Dictyobacter arantiisoli TaxID=2014874 RepID=A0A5A5T9J8_9CHLR|nr:hypothetical protein KDI_12330 [Dictyobacter arantiisoli]